MFRIRITNFGKSIYNRLFKQFDDQYYKDSVAIGCVAGLGYIAILNYDDFTTSSTFTPKMFTLRPLYGCLFGCSVGSLGVLVLRAFIIGSVASMHCIGIPYLYIKINDNNKIDNNVEK